jgi:hypothetical protein
MVSVEAFPVQLKPPTNLLSSILRSGTKTERIKKNYSLFLQL